MNTPSIETFLRLTAPKHPEISRIPHGVAQILEKACNEVYALLALAHAEVAASHQPPDVIGTVIPWEGHDNLQLEYKAATPGGRVRLLDIRCRGASVAEHLMTGLWDSAEAWLAENITEQPSESRSRKITAMDRADERAERAA